MVTSYRVATLFDSGRWQDRCGHIDHRFGSPTQNANFVVSCLLYLLKSGDKDFADEIFNDLENLLCEFTKMDKDEDGMLESPLPGTPGSPASGYNDCLSVGHKDTYMNVCVFDAFVSFADLCLWLGKTDKSSYYQDFAKKIADGINSQMWDDNKECYIAWQDINGKKYNHWHTFINFYASNIGMVPQERQRLMLKSFLSH